jgi:hypothetical protein
MLSDEDNETPRQSEHEIKYASNVSQSVVFVMTDDKIYHYNWHRSDQDQCEIQNNLKVFDQIVLNDDAVQNIQEIEINDPELCLPNEKE